MAKPNCTVSGCEKPSRNPKSPGLCEMHYCRKYKHGSTDAQALTSGISVSHGRRYRTAYRLGHPLANERGYGQAHRFILYDKIGMGPHPCHWCKTSLDWVPKGAPNCLEVDHLNDIGDDNRPENLVPSCRRCNSARGVERRRQALRDAGWWSAHDTAHNDVAYRQRKASASARE